MTEPPPPSPEELGRSYGEMLDHQAWQVDVGEPAAEPPPSGTAPPPPEVPPPPRRIIEALLFVGGPPLTAARAGEIVRGLSEAQFHQALEELNQEYRTRGRPYHIKAQEPGFVLTLRPRYRAVADRLYGSVREARLSPAALDVLSLVAYRQPCTKQEIDSLRGAESGSLLRQLVRRNLVAVTHRGEAGSREVAYGTTPRFLELFGLSGLGDLPRTQDLQIL